MRPAGPGAAGERLRLVEGGIAAEAGWRRALARSRAEADGRARRRFLEALLAVSVVLTALAGVVVPRLH